MDNLKVSEFQRRKYGFFHWVKERFYERSVGHLLREGQLPASVLDNELLLKDGNALTRLLPYESCDDGFFRNQDTVGVVYRVDCRMGAQDVQDLMFALAGAGQLVQLTSVMAAAGDNLLLAISGDYERLADLKTAITLHVEPVAAWLELLEPQQFIGILRPFFQSASEYPACGYDDQKLINTQFGDVEGSLDFDCMKLGNREIRFYAVSRWEHGGWHLINRIPRVMPEGYVVVITHAVCRSDDAQKIMTSTTVVSSLPRSDSKADTGKFRLESLFATQSWILEREITLQPLVLMNTLPMAVTTAARKLLLKRRYVTASNNHLATALFLRCV